MADWKVAWEVGGDPIIADILWRNMSIGAEKYGAIGVEKNADANPSAAFQLVFGVGRHWLGRLCQSWAEFTNE